MPQENFEIKITTTADLNAARQAEAALERQITKAKSLGQDSVALEGRLQGVRSAIAKSESGGFFDKLKSQLSGVVEQIPGLSGLTSVFTTLASGPLAVVAATIGSITAGFKLATEAIHEFEESEVKVTELDAALAQQGQLTDAYREKLQELAGQMQETTGIADEKWLGVLTTLTKFGASPENIDQYAEAVKNLAGFMGGDIESAAFLFGKAMAGNTAALSRYGIHLDASASKSEKLNQLMEQLAQKGGGQLEARAETIRGRFAVLANTTSDLLEGIGRLISKTQILQSALGLLNEATHILGSFLPSITDKVDSLTNKLPPLKASSEGAAAAMDDLGESAAGSAGGIKKSKDAVEELLASYDKAIQSAQDLRRAQDELADARQALELGKLDLEEKKKLGSASSDSEKQDIKEDFSKRRLNLRADFEKQRAAENVARIDEDLSKNSNEQFSSSQSLQRSQGERSAIQKNLDSAIGEAKSRGLKSQEERLLEELAKFDREIRESGGITGEKRNKRFEELNGQRAELKQRVDSGLVNFDAGTNEGDAVNRTRQAFLDADAKVKTQYEQTTRALEELQKREEALLKRRELELIKAQAAEIKVSGEQEDLGQKQRDRVSEESKKKAEAERAESIRAQENLIREQELKDASRDSIVKERQKLVDMKLSPTATEEEKRSAGLEKEEISRRAQEEDERERRKEAEKKEKEAQIAAKKIGASGLPISLTGRRFGDGDRSLDSQLDVEKDHRVEKDSMSRLNESLKAFQDGATVEEINRAVEAIAGVAEAYRSATSEQRAALADFNAQLKTLASQIANNRPN